MARAQRIPHMFDTIYYSSKEGKEFQALLDYVHDHADKVPRPSSLLFVLASSHACMHCS